MFKIRFVAISGGEREIFVAANSRVDAVLVASAYRDFGIVLSCTQLPK